MSMVSKAVSKIAGMNAARIFAAIGQRCAVVTFFAILAPLPAVAVDLGHVSVQSALGQPLRATMTVPGTISAGKMGGCFSATLASASEAFVITPHIVVKPGPTDTVLSLTTTQPIDESAPILTVDMQCGDTVHKEQTLLLTSPAVASRTAPPFSTDSPGLAANASPTLPAPPSRMVVAPSTAQPVASDTPPPPQHTVPRTMVSDAHAAQLSSLPGLRLKVISSLRASEPNQTRDTQNSGLTTAAETRAAQSRFAALLRNEAPAESVISDNSPLLEPLQARLQAMNVEMTELRQTGIRDAAALKRMRQQADPFGLIPALLVLLLISLGAIVWLLVKVRHLTRTVSLPVTGHNASAPAMAGAVDNAGLQDTSPTGSPDTSSLAHHPLLAAETGDTQDAAFPDSPTAELHASPDLSVPLPAIPEAVSGIAVSDKGHVSDAVVPASASATLSASQLDTYDVADIRLQHAVFEEISDVMQEAEFWISLHDAQRAIEVLEPYATFEQHHSPIPWLYLFDLYIEIGLRDKYTVLLERFHHVFNVSIPTWDAQTDEALPPATMSGGIQDLPHIAQNICDLWDSGPVVPYLESLLVDDRDGTRQGFDLSVYKEIMFLIAIAHEIMQQRDMAGTAGDASGFTRAA